MMPVDMDDEPNPFPKKTKITNIQKGAETPRTRSSTKGASSTRPPPGPSNPKRQIETGEPGQPVETYQTYVSSAEFRSDSAWAALKKCASLSIRDQDETKEFWQENSPILRNWLDKDLAMAVRSVIDAAPDGLVALKWCVKGISIGMSIGKEKSYVDLVHQLSAAVETSGNMLIRLREETKSHQDQTIEFVKQVGNASETVARIQATVEQFQLETVKRQITPVQLRMPEYKATPGPSTGPEPMIVDLPPSIGTPVERLMTAGTYQHVLGTVKLTEETIVSIDSKDNSLASLKCLRGRPMQLCLLVLNKDLSIIQVKASDHLNWLSKIFDQEKEKWKPMLVDLLSPIPIKTFQWTRKDMD